MYLDQLPAVDYLRYTKYPSAKAVAIMLNDVHGLHMREDNILSFRTEPYEDRHRLIATLNPNSRTQSDGVTYSGDIHVLYTKMNAGSVYPSGFTLPSSMPVSVPSIIKALLEATQVRLDERECEIQVDGDLRYLVFKPTALLWMGRIRLNFASSIEYVNEPVPSDRIDLSVLLDGAFIGEFE